MTAPDLRQHALNAVAIESTRGWKLAKEKTSKKIDAVVALSMACVAALEHTFNSQGIATIKADTAWQAVYWRHAPRNEDAVAEALGASLELGAWSWQEAAARRR